MLFFLLLFFVWASNQIGGVTFLQKPSDERQSHHKIYCNFCSIDLYFSHMLWTIITTTDFDIYSGVLSSLEIMVQ